MSITRAAVTLATLALLLPAWPAHAADCRPAPVPDPPRAVANDNRIAAGTLRDGVVTLRLVVRQTSWYPDGLEGCSLRVHAFAEEGKPAQIPGPLIRVREGTDVLVRVRNALAAAVWVRGLQDRDTGMLDSTELAPGATREFRFRATTIGAWYYWAGSASARVPASTADGQLVGALVVDPAAAAHKHAGDRVFVMTRWTPTGTAGNRGFQVNAINGRSWPSTERLTYTQGDSVRWHVINASDELHMMHLHGFYYRVDARGDAAHDSALARTRPATVVSVATRPGEWMSMTWAPERAGNWLFHCHFVTHMSADQRLDRMSGRDAPSVPQEHSTGAASPAASHATESMAGLLLGITVRAAPAARADRMRAAVSAPPVRPIDLYANARPRVFGERPALGFIVQQGPNPPAADSVLIPGTPLLLTRGEPTAITVHNRLPMPLAVHWHGIELESYSDGVAGWSGSGRRVAPLIAPGSAFVARLTPPRSGTFMYHVHNEHNDELASGLYAPLLVLEPGRAFDPQTDRVFVIATAGPGAGRGEDAAPFVNGTITPDTLALIIGTTYRFRLIDISANEAHVITLMGAGGAATWRVLARDGRDLPREQATSQLAREVMAAGVTRDFEFTPAAAGDYALSVSPVVASRPTGHLTTVPIRVR